MSELVCAVDGCPRTAKARGFCRSHHRRWLKDGDPGDVFTPRQSGGFRHGTNHAYCTHKCRCEDCVAFKKAKDRRDRAARKAKVAAGNARVPHGTTTGYSKWSCRCDPCSEAHAEYMKTWRKENPEKTAEYARRWREAHASEIREYRPRNAGGGDHGITMYGLGCRCDVCVNTKAEYLAEWRARKTPEEIPHGTDNGYNNYGCKCSECKRAHLDRTNKQRLRYQAETLPTARNHENLWTGAELEIVVTRTDLSLSKLAQLLGRTRHAVASARWRATTDPKWIAVVGASTAVVSDDDHATH